MIWIRLFVIIIVILMAIYYAMLVLQCTTPWFRMTNRKITFKRCLVPFYYWATSVDEKKPRTSDYADEESGEIDEREKKINDRVNGKKETDQNIQ